MHKENICWGLEPKWWHGSDQRITIAGRGVQVAHLNIPQASLELCCVVYKVLGLLGAKALTFVHAPISDMCADFTDEWATWPHGLHFNLQPTWQSKQTPRNTYTILFEGRVSIAGYITSISFPTQLMSAWLNFVVGFAVNLWDKQSDQFPQTCRIKHRFTRCLNRSSSEQHVFLDPLQGCSQNNTADRFTWLISLNHWLWLNFLLGSGGRSSDADAKDS